MFTPAAPFPLRPVAAFALAATVISTPAQAEAPGQLQPVHVSASRTGEQTARLPAGSVVLTQDDIARLPARDLAEVLDTVGGLHATRYYGLGDSRVAVGMLGFGENATANTLVLLNGRRLNDVDLTGVDFSAIPLAMIERIEVIPGSGAVLYGNGASAGIINIITRENPDTGGGISVTGGSFDTRIGDAWGAASNSRSSILGSVRAHNSDGYRDNNRMQQRSAFADLRHRLDDTTFYLTAQADTQKLGIPGGRLVTPGVTNEFRDDPEGTATPLDWAEQDGVYVMPGVVIHTEAVNIHLEAGARRKRQEYYYDFSGAPHYGETEITGMSLTPRLTGTVQTGPVRHDWTAGWELYHSDYESDTADSPANIGNPTGTKDIEQRMEAWYAQSTSQLTDALHLTAGLRTEKLTQHTEETSQFGNGVERTSDRYDIYEAGLSYFPVPTLALFVSGARNARVATVDELSPAFGLGTLRPQTGKLYTTGLRWQEGPQRSALTYFRGRYENEIIYDPGAGPSGGNVNLDDDTRRDGVTLNSQWTLDDGLWMTFNATLQRARFVNGPYARNDVPGVPRRSGYLQFDWRALDWLQLSVAQRYVGKRYIGNDLANNFGERLRSYRWTDLSATARYQQFYLRAAVHNLQDRNVTDIAFLDPTGASYTTYPLPGRHYMVTVGAEF